jgi:hypothetical protein
MYHVTEEGCDYRVLVGKPQAKDELEGRYIGARIILKCMSNKWDEIVDWFDLAQDVEG